MPEEVKAAPTTFDEVASIEDSSERNDAISKWAEKEVAGEVEDGKLKDAPVKEEKEVKEELDPDKDKDKDPEKETPGEEEEDPDPEKDTLEKEKPDGDEDPEKETPDEPTEEEIAQQKEEREERVKGHMAKHSVSAEAAEKLESSIEKSIEKYGGDVREIAKASLFAQRMHSKLQHEIKEAQRMQMNPFEWKGDVCKLTQENGKVVEMDTDKLISDYKSKNEEDAKDLDDKAILVLIKQDQKNWFDSTSRQEMSKVQENAKSICSEFAKSLPDDKFKETIIRGMGGVDAFDVTRGFDLNQVVELVKGKSYEKDMADEKAASKKREKAAFEKGRKASKIAGKESKGADSVGGDKKETTGTGMTEADKDEAHKLFNPRGSLSDADTYKTWKEYKAETEETKK